MNYYYSTNNYKQIYEYVKCMNKSNLNNSKYLSINKLYSYTVVALTKTILTDGLCIAFTNTVSKGIYFFNFIIVLKISHCNNILFCNNKLVFNIYR